MAIEREEFDKKTNMPSLAAWLKFFASVSAGVLGGIFLHPDGMNVWLCAGWGMMWFYVAVFIVAMCELLCMTIRKDI